MDWLIYGLGAAGLLRAGDGLHRPARDRAPGARQDLRRPDHPVLRGLRQDAVVPVPRRDRVRLQGRPAGRLRPLRRHVPAGQGQPRTSVRTARTGIVPGARRQRPGRRVGDRPPEDEGRLFYQKKVLAEADHHGRRPDDEPPAGLRDPARRHRDVRRQPHPADREPGPGVHRRGRTQPTDDCAGKPTTPAYASGIQTGDTIVAFNGQPVSYWDEMSAADPGQPGPARADHRRCATGRPCS